MDKLNKSGDDNEFGDASDLVALEDGAGEGNGDLDDVDNGEYGNGDDADDGEVAGF